jgi:predicted secreted protein
MKSVCNALVMLILLSTTTVSNAADNTLPVCISKQYWGAEIPSDRIELIAPDIAENGSVVSIGVKKIRSVPQGRYVREISFFNEFRTEPVASFKLSRQMQSENLKTRIRLRGSSNLYAVAMLDDGQLLGGKRHIKVTMEGCGGGGGSARIVSDDLRVCPDK